MVFACKSFIHRYVGELEFFLKTYRIERVFEDCFLSLELTWRWTSRVILELLLHFHGFVWYAICWQQVVEVVLPYEKQRRVEQILRSQEQGAKIIIFCSTKRMCDMLARNLGREFGAAAIHGDKSQGERDFVLSQFRAGRTPILVATDVAARGLDIKDIR